MQQISPNPNPTATQGKNPQEPNTAHNSIACPKQPSSVKDCEWELLAQEAFERSYYIHLAYSAY